LAFYRQLSDGDSYYRESLAQAFDTARAPILQKAAQSFAQAKASWNLYRSNGGIDGGMRVSRRISADYEQQVGLLADAMQQASDATGAYESVGETPVPDWTELRDEVRLEIVRQRQWLADVEQVVGPAIIQQKLGMLPVLNEAGGRK
jgi:hypothetical protein